MCLRVLILRPGLHELFEVAGPAHLLTGDGAVNGDVVAGDVLEDAGVGRRLAPFVVLWLEPVDRHDELQPMQALPLDRDRAHGARDDLRIDAALSEHGQQLRQLAIAHERFTADNRQMERLMPIDERDHAVDECLALQIANIAQRDAAAEMLIAIGVTTGAAKRALTRDFDREVRSVPCEDPSPGAYYTVHIFSFGGLTSPARTRGVRSGGSDGRSCCMAASS